MSSGISENYRELTSEELDIFAEDYEKAWRDPTMPERQYRRIVADELVRFRAGEEIRPYRVAVDCLRQLPAMDKPSLLDVGASTGYYSEVLSISGFNCEYTGLDYSPDFQRVAKKMYPGIRFDVGDARKLPYEDAAFDIVLHGACIMHIKEHGDAIREAARVTRKYAIFHRTPIEEQKGTVCYAKEAYGIPVAEWHFAPKYLLDLFRSSGLRVINQVDVFMTDSGYGHRTYVTERT